MKITIPNRFVATAWDHPTWDAAYEIIVRAGQGDAAAKRLLDGLKAGAAAGNALVVRVKTNFDAAAKLVIAGHGRPSAFVAQHRRQSPLLPGGGGATSRQAAIIRQQAEQIKKMRAAQIERVKHERLHRQAQGKLAATRMAADAEIARVEDQLAAVQKVLEQRTIDDEMRKRLEAQAEQYEALIDRLKTPAASNEPTMTTEGVKAERAEASADDSAEAYPTGSGGVPGDVEFSNAGE